MGDFIHGVKYHKVKNAVVKYKVSLLTRWDLPHSISAQGKRLAWQTCLSDYATLLHLVGIMSTCPQAHAYIPLGHVIT